MRIVGRIEALPSQHRAPHGDPRVGGFPARQLRVAAQITANIAGGQFQDRRHAIIRCAKSWQLRAGTRALRRSASKCGRALVVLKFLEDPAREVIGRIRIGRPCTKDGALKSANCWPSVTCGDSNTNCQASKSSGNARSPACSAPPPRAAKAAIRERTVGVRSTQRDVMVSSRCGSADREE